MASNGSVAIVTGAAQGIGYAISDILLQEGYKVCLADVNVKKGRETLAEFEKKYDARKITFVECDVSSKASFEELFSKTQQKFGKIDLLVNNAGILGEVDVERTVAINLLGPVYGIHLALKYMGKSNGGIGGIVVSVASIAGLLPSEGLPVYAATKHGVVGLTRSYGSQNHFQRNNIIFMAVCPMSVSTSMLDTVNTKALIPIDEALLATAYEPKFVAEGVLKLLKDKQNGSTLIVSPGGLIYSELQEELKKILEF